MDKPAFRAAILTHLRRNQLNQADLAGRAKTSLYVLSSLIHDEVRIHPGVSEKHRRGFAGSIAKIARQIGVDPRQALTAYDLSAYEQEN